MLLHTNNIYEDAALFTHVNRKKSRKESRTCSNGGMLFQTHVKRYVHFLPNILSRILAHTIDISDNAAKTKLSR